MLRSMKDLEDYRLGTTDGVTGCVNNFYVDQKTWLIRHMTANTGPWRFGRNVQVAAHSIGRPNWSEKILPVWLTKAQLGRCPVAVTADRIPDAAGIALATPGIPAVTTAAAMQAATTPPREPDAGLLSCNAIMRCRIQALDRRSGHVHGLLINDDTWAVKYLIMATNHWWAGHLVLIESQSVLSVGESNAIITVNLSGEAVAASPRYELDTQLAREKALDVYADYAHLGYWASLVKGARAMLDR